MPLPFAIFANTIMTTILKEVKIMFEFIASVLVIAILWKILKSIH